MQTPTHLFARLALWPLSLLYRVAVKARVGLYGRGWLRAEHVSVPVISVGNLSVGGTGKTPLVSKICRVLQELGTRPAIVSRGYHRRSGEAITVVSRGDGTGPQVGARAAGDEPYLLAQSLPGVAVVVGANRVEAARVAVRDLGAEVIVADDAYQHLRLARDLNLLVIDATTPTHAGWVLPAGRLREPLEAAARATAFLLTRCDRIGQTTGAEEIFRRQNASAPFFHTVTRPVELLRPDGSTLPPDALEDRPVAAFCGLGTPGFFLQDLERCGAKVVHFEAFPDHHWYSDSDLDRLAAAAEGAGASWVITTEKDHARLSEKQRGAHPLTRLRIDVEFWDDRKFRKFLRRQLQREAAA